MLRIIFASVIAGSLQASVALGPIIWHKFNDSANIGQVDLNSQISTKISIQSIAPK